MKPPCAVESCQRDRYVREWCRDHYNKWKAHGDPLGGSDWSPRMTPVDRFWRNVTPLTDDVCWEWQGNKNRLGYGVMKIQNRRIGSHRFSAMLHFGMFDRRAMVCHHCDNPSCVNPSHLYVGDAASNAEDMVRRGRARGGRPPLDDACGKGHPRTTENVYVNPAGKRSCRACSTARARQARAQLKGASR